MHIPDGMLPLGVCIGGYATTAALTGYSLRHINQHDNPQEHIPKASLLAVAFFVASWVHIPIHPTSVHLVLNGLMGAILGYYAFPAILVALFFQAVMFGHGGLTTLGVNATMMGLPALVSFFIFRLRMVAGNNNQMATGGLGFVAGAAGVGLATLLFYAILITTIPANIDPAIERVAITALVIAHVPLMLIEGACTALVVLFLQRVKPELLLQSRGISHLLPHVPHG